MAPHRQGAQIAQGVRWLHQARGAPGRLQPILAGGRDGVNVPLRHKAWKEGATATVSVVDRRGTRVDTVSLGQRPASGQTTLPTHLPALLQAILQHGDAHGLRLVSGSDDGAHPRDYDHTVLNTMPDPKRPWGQRTWRRLNVPACPGPSQADKSSWTFG